MICPDCDPFTSRNNEYRRACPQPYLLFFQNRLRFGFSMRRVCAPCGGEGRSWNPHLRTTHHHLTVAFQLPSSSKAAAEFLELGLDHHKKTRTLPIYFSMILDALEQTTDSTDSSDPYNTYAAILGGPIFEDSYVEKLRKSLRAFVTPGQCLGFLSQTKSALERVNSESSRQRNTLGAETSKRLRKRRKLDLESTACSSVKAINFAFVCSVIAIIWPSLPIHSLPEESRSEAVNEIQGINTSIIRPSLSVGLKQEHNEEGGGVSRSWPRDIITCSVLRLQYALSTCPAFGFRSTYDNGMESRMLKLLEPSGVLPELKIEIVNRTLFWCKTLTDFCPRGGHFS